MFGEKDRWRGEGVEGLVLQRSLKKRLRLVGIRFSGGSVERVVSVFDWGLQHISSRYIIERIENHLTKAIPDM